MAVPWLFAPCLLTAVSWFNMTACGFPFPLAYCHLLTRNSLLHPTGSEFPSDGPPVTLFADGNLVVYLTGSEFSTGRSCSTSLLSPAYKLLMRTRHFTLTVSEFPNGNSLARYLSLIRTPWWPDPIECEFLPHHPFPRLVTTC